MHYRVQLAGAEDLNPIQAVYEKARKFMAANGNPTQWGSTYPDRELLSEDIAKKQLYKILDKDRICGVFVFFQGEDPTYRVITQGAWRRQEAYGVLHRVAGDGSGGILKTALAFARGSCGYLRIDTHENNCVMQHALEKYGFVKCGIIFTDDGTPRIAYDAL